MSAKSLTTLYSAKESINLKLELLRMFHEMILFCKTIAIDESLRLKIENCDYHLQSE